MDFKEILKSNGLDDAVVNSILGSMSEHKIFTTTEEKIEERYAKAKEKNNELKEELEKSTKLITSLEEKAKENESVQLEIQGYKNQIQELTEKREHDRLESYIELGLTKNKAKNNTAVKALLDLTKITKDEEGNFHGLTEELDRVKSENDYLFASEDKQADNQPHIFQGGNTNPANGTHEEEDSFLKGFFSNK